MVWHLLGMKMPEFEKVKFPEEQPDSAVISREKWKKLYPDGGAGSDLSYVSEEKGGVFFDFLVNSLCLYLDMIDKQ